MENTKDIRKDNERILPRLMSNFIGLYDIRDAVKSDTNLILATFLRGLYYGDSWFSLIPKQTFMIHYKPVVESLLQNPMINIKVACLPEDQNVVIGYSILSADYQTIHWVYVKNHWRNKGIATSLLPHYPTTVTHLTRLGKDLLNKFETKPIFNPFFK